MPASDGATRETLRKVLDIALDYARIDLLGAREAYKGYEHRIAPYERAVKELEEIDAAMREGNEQSEGGEG